MTLFRRLITSSTSDKSLDAFLSENIQFFYELHNSSIANLNAEKDDICEFIETKRLILEKLDFTKNTNKSFISIIFDFSERFGFLSIVNIENTLKLKTDSREAIMEPAEKKGNTRFLAGAR